MSDAGQKVVEATGYVPLPANARANLDPAKLR